MTMMIDWTQILLSLCTHIAKIVRPHLDGAGVRALAGIAQSGDTTFAVDEVAEKATQEFLEKSGLPVALYSEDRGLVEISGHPEYLLLVDPIDGTRPATAGLETTCVVASVTGYSPDPRQSDVLAACVLELRGERAFCAGRGQGTVILSQNNGRKSPVNLSLNEDLERLYWAYEIVGRPARIVAAVQGGLVDMSSVKGGVFVLSSASYALSRLLTGQFDAHIDVSASILQRCPQTREEFLRAGSGGIVNLHPYDISAAILVAQEAGCVLTDSEGRSHDGMRLLDSSEFNLQTMVAASNSRLHERLMDYLTESMNRFLAR